MQRQGFGTDLFGAPSTREQHGKLTDIIILTLYTIKSSWQSSTAVPSHIFCFPKFHLKLDAFVLFCFLACFDLFDILWPGAGASKTAVLLLNGAQWGCGTANQGAASQAQCQERVQTRWWSCNYAQGLAVFFPRGFPDLSKVFKSLNHQQKQHNFIHDDNSDLCFTGASKQRQCLSLGACVFYGVVYRSTPDICFITVKPKRRFGFLDNFLMIVFGDLIDSTLCVTWPARKASEHLVFGP